MNKIYKDRIRISKCSYCNLYPVSTNQKVDGYFTRKYECYACGSVVRDQKIIVAILTWNYLQRLQKKKLGF